MGNQCSDGYKQCRRCGECKPATTEYFNIHKTAAGGLHPMCRVCRNYVRKFGADPRTRPDGQKKCRKCGECKPATKEYFYRSIGCKDNLYPLCKNCKDTQDRQRRDNNPQLQLRREMQKREMQHKKQRARERYPERARINSLRRRTRKRELPNTFSSQNWRIALDYFANACAVCGRPESEGFVLAMDHWIPLSSDDCLGTVASNIVPLCHARKGFTDGCNNSKFNRSPAEWLIWRYGEKQAAEILARIQAYFDHVANQ